MRDKAILLAVASLLGTIIGAGVFAIPYVFSKSGIATCFFYFLILGAIILLLHLFFGEVVLRTKEKYRLVGYTKKYLGKKAGVFVGASTILGTIGALLAYIILAGKFFGIIFPSFLSSFQWTLILWFVMSLFVCLGIKLIALAELFMNIGLFLAIFTIFGFCLPKIQLANFILAQPQQIFLPFGILLFSLIGWSAVPEVEGILKEKKNLKKVIFSAMLISLCFYFVFGLFVSGVTGSATTEDAFSGLVPFLGQKVMFLGSIFGFFAVATSFLILGNYLKNTLRLDYNLPYVPSFFIACFSPLFLFLVGLRGFIAVITVVGTFVGLIEGIAIALLYKEAKKRGDRTPEYSLAVSDTVAYLTIAILVLGTLSQIVYHFA